MYHSIYDFRDFYNTPMGGVVRHILRRKIRFFWPNVKGMRVVGIGCAQPYLDMFLSEAECCIAINPASQGSFSWPEQGANLSVLAEETELPIETNSVDRAILVHALEFGELPQSNLKEIYRILKSNGRLLVIVPNRRGLWSRAEWSPFGHGTPYSGDQLRTVLRESLFVFERSSMALFAPPARYNLIQKSFGTFDLILSLILPAIGGVHVVEVSKQVYAGTSVPVGAKVIIRARPAAAGLQTLTTDE